MNEELVPVARPSDERFARAVWVSPLPHAVPNDGPITFSSEGQGS